MFWDVQAIVMVFDDLEFKRMLSAHESAHFDQS